MRRSFLLAFLAIILLGLFLRLFIIGNNNFFFTVDQGRDAVYVREILERGRIFTKGPETNIRGIFAGPLFFYFTSFGFLVTGGHPVGGVLMMISLNLALTVLVVLWLKNKVGGISALLIGTALQFYWSFFETSLWSFNPFPLVILSFILIMLLIEFLKGKPRYYLYALVPILLAGNFEVAGAIAIFIFYLIVGIYGVIKNLISGKFFVVIGILLPASGALILARPFIINFIATRFFGATSVTAGKSGAQVFSGTNFNGMLEEFLKIIGTTTVPQNIAFGAIFFVLVLLLAFRYRRKINKDLRNFIILSLSLGFVSYVFFSLTLGWRSWQTVYLPPLLFVSLLLILTQIPKRIGMSLFILIMIFQIANFRQRYFEYLEPSGNPSLLYNQTSAIDWIYQKSGKLGFRVYNYTDTFYDYPYQYLFWWYGLRKYEYLPDEYSNFPLSHKSLYVPGNEFYTTPSRSGENLKYLIIQSETNGEDNFDWPKKFREFHDLIDETKVGDIKIEKYLRKNGAPNDLCIWWSKCEVK